MATRSALFPALALAFTCTAAGAADTNHQFAIEGMGLLSCERFVAARRDQSPEYHQFGGWLNGYLSASNRYEPDTFDLTPWQSTGLLAAWLARYCGEHPKTPFVQAVAALVNLLGKDRLTQRSERVAVKIDAHTRYLYTAVIQRIQQRLAQLGHYRGEADGVPGPATSEALRGFQQSAGLPADGLPDQRTLAKLFR